MQGDATVLFFFFFPVNVMSSYVIGTAASAILIAISLANNGTYIASLGIITC